jgi:hypothetical protein
MTERRADAELAKGDVPTSGGRAACGRAAAVGAHRLLGRGLTAQRAASGKVHDR